MATVATALAAPGPAGAHFCATPVEATPGRRAAVVVGVAAEAEALVEVAVHVPAGFRLDGVGGSPGWTAAVDGATVRFTGGTIAPFTCGYFSLVGVAPDRGVLAMPLTVRTAGGRSVEYRSREFGDPYAAQLVYVGVKPEASAGGGNFRPGRLVGAGLVGAGLAGLAAWAVRRRPSGAGAR